jgi:hypothetical protein
MTFVPVETLEQVIAVAMDGAASPGHKRRTDPDA